MVDVIVCTPGTEMRAEYVGSLSATLAALAARGMSWQFAGGQSSLVHHAREIVATCGPLDADHTAPFSGREYQTMLWIDSDIGWHPEDALRLIDSPHDVTTGVYKLADGVTTSVHAWDRPGQGILADEIAAMTKPVTVQSCGFGFVAIKRGVFERMARPWFAHLSQPILRSDGSAIMDSLGEDISWCVRAYQAGIEVWLDPSVRVTHHKTIGIGWPNG